MSERAFDLASEVHETARYLARLYGQLRLAREPRQARIERAIEEKKLEEERWTQGLELLDASLHEQLSRHDFDTAITYAQSEWALVTKASSPNADEIRARLMAGTSRAAFAAGGVQLYVGLAVPTSELAGQASLDYMGLNKTFAWANARSMARDMFQVRGSKIVQSMYGSHVDQLSKLIIRATDPRNPLTLAEVKKEIERQWPGLRKSQISRIARTETATLWTHTQMQAYLANGVSEFSSIVAEGPTIGVQSEMPCDTCVAVAADSPWPIEKAEWPPWHPQCRCEAIPELVSPDGTPWLPPDEPWTGGGNLPIQAETLNGLGEASLSRGAIRPAPEPVPTPSEILLEDEWSALIEEMQTLETSAANTYTKFAIGGHEPGVSRLYVLRDADDALRGAIRFEERADTVYIHDLGSTVKDGGTELTRAAARAATDAKKDLTVTADPDARGFYERLGFKAEKEELEYRLAGKDLDQLATRQGEAGHAISNPNPVTPSGDAGGAARFQGDTRGIHRALKDAGEPEKAVVENRDVLTEAMAKIQGFDGRPIEISGVELDKLIQQGGRELWRTFRTQEQLDQFLHGEFFVSAELGSGLWTALSRLGMEALAPAGARGVSVRMVLSPKARVIDIADLKLEQQQIVKDALEDLTKVPAHGTYENFILNLADETRYGRIGTALGYDAVTLVEGGHNIMVVFNRSALHVEAQVVKYVKRFTGKIPAVSTEPTALERLRKRARLT